MKVSEGENNFNLLGAVRSLRLRDFHKNNLMFILSGDKWTSILLPFEANRIETQKTTKFYEYCAVFLILSVFLRLFVYRRHSQNRKFSWFDGFIEAESVLRQ